jgi:hypothetical protein
LSEEKVGGTFFKKPKNEKKMECSLCGHSVTQKHWTDHWRKYHKVLNRVQMKELETGEYPV